MASLIETLISQSVITESQLNDAKKRQRDLHLPLHEILVQLNYLTDEALDNLSLKLFKMPLHPLSREEIDPEATKLLTSDIARRYGVFPLRKENEQLLMAMSNPHDIFALDDLVALTGYQIIPVFSTRKDIVTYIDISYKANDSLSSFMEDVVQEESKTETSKSQISDEELSSNTIAVELSGGQRVDIEEENSDSSPTVKLINLILGDAVKVRASDIHLEPREDILEVRYRVDGDLKNIMRIPKHAQSKMIARIKIMADLDIAQDVMPQDGRIHIAAKGKKVDFRVSTIPTYYGEKIVMRVLDASEAKTDLQKIGFSEKEKKIFVDAIKQPQGMILVTGPTGSGKTSSLYAALNYVKSESTNIVTIEDPVEFVNPGINQIQINPARGVTFASGLRSILRQDPNVILVGEIRDQETAEIALKASITGHLVLSTLHTNSTVATISRLADIGIDHYMIASAVILIVSQRLIKVICPQCKSEYAPDDAYREEYRDFIEQFNIKKFYRGLGCENCSYSGYHGRTAVFEVLQFNQNLKDIIAKQTSQAEIRKAAVRNGLKLLIEGGVDRVLQGMTTLEEVVHQLGTLDKSIFNQDPSPNISSAVDNQPPQPASLNDSLSSTKSKIYEDIIDEQKTEQSDSPHIPHEESSVDSEPVQKKEEPPLVDPFAQKQEHDLPLDSEPISKTSSDAKNSPSENVVKDNKDNVEDSDTEIINVEQEHLPDSSQNTQQPLEEKEEDIIIEPIYSDEIVSEVDDISNQPPEVTESSKSDEKELKSKINEKMVDQQPVVESSQNLEPNDVAELKPEIIKKDEEPETVSSHKDLIGELTNNEAVDVKSKKPSKILVVDDDQDIQKILTKVLETSGFDVIKANDGQDAIEKTFKEKPDLIIMDAIMPRMDGFEAMTVLRSKLETAVVPIMMLTSKNTSEDKANAIRDGADAFMTKPYRKDELLQKVDELLKKGNFTKGVL